MPANIHTTYGAAFLGLVVSSVMYGLTLLQTYTYFQRFPGDPRRLKLLVSMLWAIDTLHVVLCTVTIYWYLVVNFNNPEQLGITHWSMNIQTDCNGLIGLTVELFFAYRVWMISKNWLLTGVISVLAFLHFGLGVYFTVEAFVLKEYSRYNQLTWVTSAGLGGAAAADITIAVSLVYFLSRSRTGFERTDSVVATLILYAINTGLLTSICATICVITFAIMPLNFVWLAFFWCLGKLYINSLLASLNSREQLRSKTNPEGQLVQLSNLSRHEVPGSPLVKRLSRARYGHQHPLAITVETTKEQRTDYSYPPSPRDEEEHSATESKASSALSAQHQAESFHPFPQPVASTPKLPFGHN